MQLRLIVVGLILATGACGGGADGEAPLSSTEANQVCTEICDHETACGRDNPGCLDDCRILAAYFRGSALREAAACYSPERPCDQDPRECVAQIDPASNYYAWVSACGDKVVGECQINDPSYCDQFIGPLWTSDTIDSFMDCLQLPCSELTGCLNASYPFVN